MKKIELLSTALFDQLMIIFGTKPDIPDGNITRWALLTAYSFLVNIVNMKLLISIIGETFAKQ